MHVWIYYTFKYTGSFLRSRFSKFIFTELLKAFWLIQQFHARQMAVSVPGPPLRTWSGGWGRQVWGWVSLWNSLTMKDFCGLLWSTWIFLMKLFPGSRCPQTLELSASSANHSLPLTSFLATRGPCLVWGGRFLSSKSWSGCSCFNEHHAALVPGQGRGLRNLDGTWMGLLVLICATFNFTLRLGQCYSSLSSSGHWFTAARNSQEVEINMVVRKWVVSACPSMSTMSLGPTALMCWRSHYEWSKIVFFFFFTHICSPN